MKELDGRKLDHNTLEELRVRAVRRVEAGESPEVVIESLGNLIFLKQPYIQCWRTCATRQLIS